VANQKLDNKKKVEESVNDPQNRSRRSALKKLAIGAGVLAGYQVLPKQWTKPLIEQVVLPAHAQTSGFSLTDPCESITLVSGNQSSTTVIIKVQGSISPPIANVAINIAATVTGGTGETTTTSTTTDGNGNYSIEMVVNGGPGITSVFVEITATGATGSANCSVSVPDVNSVCTCSKITISNERPGTARNGWVRIRWIECGEEGWSNTRIYQPRVDGIHSVTLSCEPGTIITLFSNRPMEGQYFIYSGSAIASVDNIEDEYEIDVTLSENCGRGSIGIGVGRELE